MMNFKLFFYVYILKYIKYEITAGLGLENKERKKSATT